MVEDPVDQKPENRARSFNGTPIQKLIKEEVADGKATLRASMRRQDCPSPQTASGDTIIGLVRTYQFWKTD